MITALLLTRVLGPANNTLSEIQINVQNQGNFRHDIRHVSRVSPNSYLVVTTADECFRLRTGRFKPRRLAIEAIDAVSIAEDSTIVRTPDRLCWVGNDENKPISLAKIIGDQGLFRLHTLSYNRTEHILVSQVDSTIWWYRVTQGRDHAVALRLGGKLASKDDVRDCTVTEYGPVKLAVATSTEEGASIQDYNFQAGKFLRASRKPYLLSDYKCLTYSPSGAYLCMATQKGDVFRFKGGITDKATKFGKVGDNLTVDVDDHGDVLAGGWGERQTIALCLKDGRVVYDYTGRIFDGPWSVKIVNPGLAILADRPGTIYFLTWS